MYNIERTFLIYIYIHKAVTIYRTFLAAENEYHKDIVYNFYKRNIENAKDQETGYWIGHDQIGLWKSDLKLVV